MQACRRCSVSHGVADVILYVDVRKDYSPSNSFFGLINAVRIYNRAVSP